MKNNPKLKKLLYCVIAIVVLALALFISYKIVYSVNSKPDGAASVSENCELVHNIYIKRDAANRTFTERYLTDWNEYYYGTLHNLGLLEKDTEKKWNGQWIINEEFIREYISEYSFEEFFEIYDLYIYSYLMPSQTMLSVDSISTDKQFYTENRELFIRISETADILFNQTDLFKVVSYHPSTDEVLNTSSETVPVSGKFNVGSDNHIETKSEELIIDTYQYDGYEVEHSHGYRYDEGQYEWVNGEFIDIKSHFDPVNEYRLYVDGKCIMGPAETLEELERRLIICGEKRYYETILYGGRYSSTVSDYSDTFEFSQPVNAVSDTSREAYKAYVSYN